MDKITRRSLLSAAPALGLTAVVTVTAVAVEPEHPWVKARRLARELSETLAECDEGTMMVEVQPMGSGKSPFLFIDRVWRDETLRQSLGVDLPPLERAEHHLEQFRLVMQEHTGAEWATLFKPETGLGAVSQIWK